MQRLSLEEVQEALQEKKGWSIEEEKWLLKKYRFSSFMSGISFVHKIAELSEEENHHPFISIDYVLVTLRLSSWKARGITDLDLRLIERYDQIYASFTGD